MRQPQARRIGRALERAFEDAGAEVRTVAEIQYSMQRCALVAQGLGFSIVDPVVARDFASARIVLKPFTPRLELTTVLLFPSQRPRSRLALEFCDLLRAEDRGIQEARPRAGLTIRAACSALPDAARHDG